MSQLSGPEKAALMILAFEPATACDVMRNLNEAELRRLAASVDSMAAIPEEEVNKVYDDFTYRLGEGMSRSEASKYLRSLAAQAFGEERAKRLLAPAGVWTEPLEFLRNLRPALLAEALEEEHPQVAAAMISQLPRSQAAKVLQASSPDQQADLVRRLTEFRELPLDAMKTALASLAATLGSVGKSSTDDVSAEFDGVGFAADVLNELAPSETERLLSSLDNESPEKVTQIRRAMFSFEDLVRLPKRSMVGLLREVQAEELVVALKTASEALQTHFISAMSTRAAETLREDMAAAPPLRLAEVEQMQMKIVEVAMRLKSEGKIEIPGPGGEEMV